MLAMHAFGMPVCPMMTAMPVVTSMPGDVGRADKTCLVRPAFGQSPLRQRLVQPAQWIVAKARMQDQIRAARHHVDGVDLQHAHALDRRHHIGTRGRLSRPLQQPLCGQLHGPGLRQPQNVRDS
jgi:hypothetical protein